MPLARFRSSGGVSLVNAIGSGGYGGAAGVSLWLEARVKEEPGVYGGESRWPGGRGELSEGLVKAVAEAASRLAGARLDGLWIEVDSEVPPGRGLKSSAALLTASLGAAVSLSGVNIEPEIIAVEAAKLSLALGLSATGALDDHAASIIDAPVATWNPGFRIERVLPRAGCHLSIIIGYSSSTNPIERLDPSPFRGLRRLYLAASSLALEGRWMEAMAVNGLASAAALGMESLALEALRLGALAAGVTGKGPAFFVVTDSSSSAGVLNDLLYSSGFTSVLRVRFRWCA